jgi:hypothetical protein
MDTSVEEAAELDAVLEEEEDDTELVEESEELM